ncbi:GDYXXLXY domain-containing protein [Aquimarina mytili]|uniref:GDYXXLXY domain-containing protein n=1 Tax=Aquimarina mytili TaxID=874423 RepID=A0A936ZQL2_9FLAO|nr:GDYXXLXY domain-containing protein [Aquimarina mytili]MBL0682477.1 GDYXXLXY domain-containing protein [Aquimarina mytili]
MKIIHVFIGFVIVALIQIFVPLQMIWQQEDVLSSGEVYKFKTRPIDPTDPFRGKYITLQYEMNSFTMADTTYIQGDKIFVYIENDDAGYAKVHSLSKTDLRLDKDYVIAKVTGNHKDVINFKLPFDRFYMEETKAYDAEKAYRENNRNNTQNDVYALVHIKEGKSVLKDVIINGISIQKFVEK